MTIISPKCRMGCKCRRTSRVGAECPGFLLWNPKCGVLLPRWGSGLPCDLCHLTHTHTGSTGAVLLSRSTITCSQVLSAVLCESLCGESKSTPPAGDRNTGNSAFMAGSQRRWRNLVRLTKNSEGRLQFRVKPGMPGSSACLLWGAFKVPVFKWIHVIFNGKRNFFKMLKCGAKKILSLNCTEKSLTLLFLPPTFPFQHERWKKKQEKEVKWDYSFQTKENFQSLKISEHK